MTEDLLLFAVLGLGVGSIYALMGLGVVVVFRGTGVINFAQGGIALAATSVFVAVSDSSGSVPLGVASGLGVAAALGVGIHWFIMRPMSDAPVLSRMVATLGVLLALNAATLLRFGSDLQRPPSIVPAGAVDIGSVTVGRDRLYLFAIAVVLTAALAAIYRWTSFGRLSRAAAESELSLALVGRSPNAVSTLNWMLGCVLAAFAGMLIAPITSLSAIAFALLIVPTLAAAAVGSFSSFSLTLLGGLLIGIVQSEMVRFSPVIGLGDMVPFAVVTVMLLLRGNAIPQRGDEVLHRHPPRPSAPLRTRTVLIGAGVVLLIVSMLDRDLQMAATTSAIYAVAALSVVLITGFVGQVSLAQMTFAGVGAMVAAKASADFGMAFPLPIVVGALIMLPVGVLFGLPAFRVRGLNLAVLTLTAAVAVNGVLFKNPELTGGFDGLKVPEPELLGWSLDAFDHPMRYLGFVSVVLVAVLLAISAVRRRALGRELVAVSSSERAAANSTINVRRTKLIGFSLSAMVAGLVGGLLTFQTGRMVVIAYYPLESIILLGLVAVVGIASPGAAVVAGILAAGGVLQVVLGDVVDVSWLNLATGLAVIIVSVLAPRGLVPTVADAARRVTHRIGSRPSSGPLVSVDTAGSTPAMEGTHA